LTQAKADMNAVNGGTGLPSLFSRTKQFHYGGKPPANGVNKLKLIMEAREQVSRSLLTLIRSLLTLIRSLLTLIRSLLTLMMEAREQVSPWDSPLSPLPCPPPPLSLARALYL